MPAAYFSQRLAGAALLAAILVGGCAGTTPQSAPDITAERSAALKDDTPELIPVRRQGRYTLAELSPSAAQHDLLLQVVEVSMPAGARATVGDGLRHVLKRSGYQLCDDGLAAIELYGLPLPAAHLRLGPMTLREALHTLAGPAWKLRADVRAREVCFEPATEGTQPTSEPERPVAEVGEALPLSGGQP